MRELAPSILAADISRLGEEVKKTEEEQIRYLHIDVMDGMFVPSLSFGFPVISSLRPVSNMIFDVHLMVQEPIRYIRRFAEAGSDIITVHYEACSDLAQTLAEIKACGCKCGLSINPETPVSVVYPYVNQVDMILLMTVRPGFGGQKYIEESTERIKTLRAYLNEKNSDVFIEVDGGIHKGNISVVTEAGAELIVCGSAVFGGDIRANIRTLKEQMGMLA